MNMTKHLSIAPTKEETRWGWLYLPFFLALTGTILAGLFAFLGIDQTSAQGRALLNGVFFLVNFLAVVGIFHRFLAQSLAQVGRRFWGFVQAILLGLILYYAATFLLTWGLERLVPNLQNVNDASIGELIQVRPHLMVAGTVLLVPLTEECLIRVLIFQGLHRKNRILAYATSTLAFCLIHVFSHIGQYPALTLLLCALEYIPAGVSLAWAYEKADTVFAPILMHAVINAVSLQTTWGVF